MLSDAVKKVLEENLWDIATMSAEGPNVVPVGFKGVLPDGKLFVGDVFLETTAANVKANGKIAVSAYDAKTTEGYQVKGTAAYVAEGPLVENLRAKAEELFHGALKVKGALVITPETVIVTTPGPENKKTL